MSTKFEELLDLLINEEHEKANELFHEIVVEKSRSIYENLIAEEDDEEADESREEDDESVEEASEEEDESVDEGADEEADESIDLEDSYMMDGGDEHDDGLGGDATDDLGAEIGATDDEPEMGGEGGEEQAIFDIKNAIEELEAAFAELEASQGSEADDDFGDEEGDDEEGDDEMMGQPAFEGRKLREYSEKVGNDWEKNSQKTDGDEAGAGTGEKMSRPVAGKSPVSSGKGKPTTGATAGNILGDQKVGQGKNTGDRPDSLNKGIAQVSGEKLANGMQNVDGKKSGVKTLSKQGAGYPGNNKSAGPVGSGTGDKAGQTSVGNVKSPINGAPNRNA
jgi:hypothetical protein